MYVTSSSLIGSVATGRGMGRGMGTETRTGPGIWTGTGTGPGMGPETGLPAQRPELLPNDNRFQLAATLHIVKFCRHFCLTDLCGHKWR